MSDHSNVHTLIQCEEIKLTNSSRIADFKQTIQIVVHKLLYNSNL